MKMITLACCFVLLTMACSFAYSHISVADAASEPTETPTLEATQTVTPIPPTATETVTTGPPIATSTSTSVPLAPTSTPSAAPTQVSSETPTVTATATKVQSTPAFASSAATINPTRGTVNTNVHFALSGFPSNAPVQIFWRRVSGSIVDIRTISTNGSGAASGTFKVPATPGGSGQQIIFTSGSVSRTAHFEVKPRIKVITNPAVRDQFADVSLRGYAKNETVRIRWKNGSSWVTLKTVVTSNTGSANVDVKVPLFAPNGLNSVRGDGTAFRQQTNAVNVQGGPSGIVYQGVAKCSQALHDKYVTVAPDGKSYPTWHPLIDRENGARCSHQHDHGSNPALLHRDWHPAFGYAAAKMGMTEAHAGFKVAVVPGASDQRVGIMVHMGGGSLNRVCVRFHTFETAWLANNGSLGAVITIMGDFGKAALNDDPYGPPYAPPQCPNQASTGGSSGVRQIPVASGTTIYEPWRVDLAKTIFGFRGNFTINSRSANTVCKVYPACDINNPAVLKRTGTVRFVTGNRDPYGVLFRIDASKAKKTGRFCTDSMGRMVVSCSQSNAVAQYIAPGLSAGYPCSGHASGGKGGGVLVCGAHDIDLNETGGVPPGTPN